MHFKCPFFEDINIIIYYIKNVILYKECYIIIQYIIKKNDIKKRL